MSYADWKLKQVKRNPVVISSEPEVWVAAQEEMLLRAKKEVSYADCGEGACCARSALQYLLDLKPA